MKKRIFSGAQPTGELHIGNYLGALKNWVALQDEYESFYCIVNLHAHHSAAESRNFEPKNFGSGANLSRCGRRSEKSTIFIQSDVSEHAELHGFYHVLPAWANLSE